jgi:hypothetical protein
METGQSGVDQGFVGPKAYSTSGPSLSKIIQNYKCQIWCKSEYLCMAPTRDLEGADVKVGL